MNNLHPLPEWVRPEVDKVIDRMRELSGILYDHAQEGSTLAETQMKRLRNTLDVQLNALEWKRKNAGHSDV